MKSKKEIKNILFGMVINIIFVGIPFYILLDMNTWCSDDLWNGVVCIVAGSLFLSRLQCDIEVLEKKIEELENKK